MEADPLDVTDETDATDLSGGRWDEQLHAASEGRWEDIGLDPPDADQHANWEPVTLDTFLTGGS